MLENVRGSAGLRPKSSTREQLADREGSQGAGEDPHRGEGYPLAHDQLDHGLAIGAQRHAQPILRRRWLTAPPKP
jgi:hypothetical protein